MRVYARRRSAEEWRGIVSEWERSGMSRQAFAARYDLHPGTLSWWRWKAGQTRDASGHGFLEVVLDEARLDSAPCFEVEFDGFRVRVPHGFDGDELRRLVSVLC
jgi:transposase-like protein